MPVNIVILGSCNHEPYKVLAPNKLDSELYKEDHEKAYEEACKLFYPAIDSADIIVAWTSNGEIGEHTKADIEYALANFKKVVVFHKYGISILKYPYQLEELFSSLKE